MALITWNDNFSVGIAEIDRQHQKLFEMINELNDAMRERKGKEVLGKIITGLASYAATHFRTEERYFDQFGYPDSPDHKKIHADFAQKVNGFKNKLDTGAIGLPVEVVQFLSDWIQGHIRNIDKKYAPFLIAKGLK